MNSWPVQLLSPLSGDPGRTRPDRSLFLLVGARLVIGSKRSGVALRVGIQVTCVALAVLSLAKSIVILAKWDTGRRPARRVPQGNACAAATSLFCAGARRVAMIIFNAC
jgi:hypothetical protein